jgi:hypothetical protein
MLCGAYALAQNAHVRGDFLYSSMRPRLQAALDLVLYVTFFFPGIAALIYAGADYAADSWRIAEHSNVTADGPPVYHFKTVIPVAGALVMLQGVAEILRCVACLKTGEWQARLADVAEIDVIGEQLAHSETWTRSRAGSRSSAPTRSTKRRVSAGLAGKALARPDAVAPELSVRELRPGDGEQRDVDVSIMNFS